MPPVVVYTRNYCFYCDAAKDLLRRKNIKFEEIGVGGNPELRREMIQRASGRMTVPQVFIGDTHVGGCDDLYALEAAGRLDPLLGKREEEPA
jgi:glutaredoxin 3